MNNEKISAPHLESLLIVMLQHFEANPLLQTICFDFQSFEIEVNRSMDFDSMVMTPAPEYARHWKIEPDFQERHIARIRNFFKARLKDVQKRPWKESEYARRDRREFSKLFENIHKNNLFTICKFLEDSLTEDQLQLLLRNIYEKIQSSQQLPKDEQFDKRGKWSLTSEIYTRLVYGDSAQIDLNKGVLIRFLINKLDDTQWDNLTTFQDELLMATQAPLLASSV